MTSAELLKVLAEKNIDIKAENGRLIYHAPKGALTPELKALIACRKAELLDALAKEPKAASAWEAGATDGLHPLSHSQRFLWFLHQLAPESPAYNVAFVARIVSPIDPARLEDAFRKIVGRHDMLRTTYVSVDGVPSMRILPKLDPAFERTDASGWNAGTLEQSVAESYARPFDLAHGPLVRVHLFMAGPEDHVLLLTIHHIACDGQSIGLIMKEFKAVYSGFDPDEAPAESGAPYNDFIRLQDEMVRGPEGERLLGFWKRRLAGELPELSMPIDKPRPRLRSQNGGTHHFTLGGNIYNMTAAAARTSGVTLYTFLLSAIQTLLMRYSGQSDILVGTPAVGRPRREDAATVGCYINPLVIRGDVRAELTFRELLAGTSKAVTEALEHRDYPFSLLVEKLAPVRDPARLPVFEVMFNLLNRKTLGDTAELLYRDRKAAAAAPAVEFGVLRVKPFPLDQEEGQFDLFFEMIDDGRSLTGLIKYNSDLFEEATIAMMAGHLGTLLRSIAASPDGRLGELALLSKDEKDGIIRGLNATGTEYPRGLRLHDLFEKQAALTPEATAVVFEGASLTYSELDRRADALADRLRGMGVGPEVPVGIHLERSMEMVVCIYAVLKAGGAYMPLDPELPAERLGLMIRESGTPVVITSPKLEGRLPKTAARVFVFDLNETGEAGRAQAAAGKKDGRPGPDDMAYVIYTSGSTGIPKGVINTHKGICNRILWMQDAFKLGPDDVVLQKTPFSFDVSVWEFFWPLAVGARLVVAKPGGHRDTEYIAETINRRKVTTVHFVPSMLQLFLEDGRTAASCSSLRRVICSGEALSYELQERFFSTLSAELHNLYGPTEAAVDVTWWKCLKGDKRRLVPIGKPIANTRIHILDPRGEPVPMGVPGEIHIGGVQVARGYLNRPELTAERFVPDPFGGDPGAKLYKTGDLGRYLPDGNIEYLGRSDNQVKIRGMRIEPDEIETNIREFPGVSEALVMAREFSPGDKRLVGYVTASKTATIDPDRLRSFLKSRLAEFMVPSAFVKLEAFPLTSSGKVDRKALPAPEGTRLTRSAFAAPRSEAERRISRIWLDLLQVNDVGLDDNFFDLGGHSLLIVRMTARLKETFGKDISVVDLFQHPTVREQAEMLTGTTSEGGSRRAGGGAAAGAIGAYEPIAVIGMACRFPGAPSVEHFWDNLRNGVESIRKFSDEELDALGVPPEVYNSPGYVKAASTIDDADMFDADFFGYSPKEAGTIDPQQRLFLECGWQALENAGWDPGAFMGAIGVFAGSGPNYYGARASSSGDGRDVAETYRRELGNEKDYLATRLSYKLGLRGPSLTVQTACSTSLAAVHLAVQNLLMRQCDMALAGGVSVNVRNRGGYFYQEGMIPSPDGHCRAFDAKAMGTVVGQGVGMIVLKRLADALADGDTIHAVIMGSAMNNDGAGRVGFTAPGLDGQAEVIAAAQAAAGVSADDIGYIEAHGTGTPLGDPIEIKALTKAFRAGTDRKNYCAVGSVKTNVGHLDAAAGIAGLIKTVLVLEHGEVPPSLHFETPNPELGLETSPFFINTKLRQWPDGPTPRLAGVSSFGLGGTNVHVIVGAPPTPPAAAPDRKGQILLLSARTESALETGTAALAGYLRRNPGLDLADAAYTLQAGRKAFEHRRTIVCDDAAGAVKIMTEGGSGHMADSVAEKGRREVAFMFSGQGSQYPGMALGLYREERIFRESIDRSSEILGRELPCDLHRIIFPEDGRAAAAEERLTQTSLAQPALFAVEYALAEQWMAWGVKPQAMIGHSIGEYTAACLAGVFSLRDALRLVAVRGRLMQSMPPGGMLAVTLPQAEVEKLLGGDLDLSVVNGPSLCVVSGREEALQKLEAELERRKVVFRRVRTSHAFHSRMMEPALAPFLEELRKIELKPPTLPFISNVTGTWIAPEQATDPAYWATHLRRTVKFAQGVEVLLEEPGRVLLEVGPGRALCVMAGQHPAKKQGHLIIPTTRHALEQQPDGEFLLGTLAALWRSGVPIDWEAYHDGMKRRRVPLPAYAFDRKRFWIEKREAAPEEGPEKRPAGRTATPPGKTLAAQTSGAKSAADGRTSAEAVLTGMWEDLLGARNIGPDDDFFALGGHSLVAVTLLTNIEKEFGARIPLASLIEAPTIRSFAALLKGKSRESGWSPLVALSASGSKPPFFLMHSHGGNILEYQPLAHDLGKERPLYALQSQGLDGSPIGERTIEGMAAAYLKEMRSVQPHGPYRLGGFCFGGFLALEAAMQLREANEPVDLVVMINSSTFEYPHYAALARPFRKLFALGYRADLELSGLKGRSPKQALVHLAGRGRRMKDLLQARFEKAADPLFKRQAGRAHSLVYHLEKLAEANDRAWASYKPLPYEGRVLFFSAENQPRGVIPDPMLGWGGLLTGRVERHVIPGFRQTMLDEPNVRVLAGLLKTALDDLDSGRGL